MNVNPPSMLSRLSIALSSFFKILGNSDFAARVRALNDSPSSPTPTAATPPPAPAAPPLRQAAPDGALQLLGLLQREARFIDFIQEDVAAYADADIGAAARVVHEGCRKVLRDNFTLGVVRDEAEGSRVTLPAGFDAAAVRITGNVVGTAPFTGCLTHRGWQVVDTRLPKLSEKHDLRIIAPAEVEL
ncbi:MAG: DUF2760 domain-containing protein [Candidatus Accumulibacter sp.]|nr:DUF2760 domain-containing protein [Accumulibacter sp.]